MVTCIILCLDCGSKCACIFVILRQFQSFLQIKLVVLQFLIHIAGPRSAVGRALDSLVKIPDLATYFLFSFRFFKKGSCQLLVKVCALSTG